MMPDTETRNADTDRRIAELEADVLFLRAAVAALLELAHKDSQLDTERLRILQAYVLPAWEQTRSLTPPLQRSNTTERK